MKTLRYDRRPGYFKQVLLWEELENSVPEFWGPVVGPVVQPQLFGAVDGSWVEVVVYDGVDTIEVDAVVDLHDSSVLSQGEIEAQIADDFDEFFADIPMLGHLTNAEAQALIDQHLVPEIGATAPKTLKAIRELTEAVIYVRNARRPDLQNRS